MSHFLRTFCSFVLKIASSKARGGTNRLAFREQTDRVTIPSTATDNHADFMTRFFPISCLPLLSSKGTQSTLCQCAFRHAIVFKVSRHFLQPPMRNINIKTLLSILSAFMTFSSIHKSEVAEKYDMRKNIFLREDSHFALCNYFKIQIIALIDSQDMPSHMHTLIIGFEGMHSEDMNDGPEWD